MRRVKAKAKTSKATRNRRPWLPCPRCESQSSEVVRVLKRVGDRIRQCCDCGERFRTTETVCRATGVQSALPVLESLIKAMKAAPHSAVPTIK